MVEVDKNAASVLAKGVPSARINGVPLSDGTFADFIVSPFQIFTADAKIVGFDGVNESPVARPQLTAYQGKSADKYGLSIYLSVADETDLWVVASGAGSGTTLIIPTRGPDGVKHVLSGGDSNALRQFQCTADEILENQQYRSTFREPAVGRSAESEVTLLVPYLIDVSNGLYQQFGSDMNDTSVYVGNVMGTVSAIFQRDINTVVAIKYLIIWTTPDPFGTVSTTDQLNNYLTYNMDNREGLERAGAHLFSHNALLGGRAYVGVLCGIGAYAVSNFVGNATFPVIGAHNDIFITAHEKGHNFGSIHTHCYDPPIDCCDTECASLCPSVIPQSGTIMSYCNGVTMEFHDRVQEVMRAHVEERSCIGEYFEEATIEVLGNDIAIVNGSVTPESANGTDFGLVSIGGETATRAFQINNLGTQTLSLTGTPPVQISPAGPFAVSAQPAGSILGLFSDVFEVTFDPSVTGVTEATVTIANNDAGANPFTFAISGQRWNASLPETYTWTGNVVIHEAVTSNIDIPLEISGVPGTIAEVKFLIGGSSCTNDAGDPNVGLAHTWVSDLVLTLRSPANTSVVLIDSRGGPGNNFCQTELTDSALVPISSIEPWDAPFTGAFTPEEPLSTFNGEDPNGTWTLNVMDTVAFDGGVVRDFSVIIRHEIEVTTVEAWSLYD